jgi:hypothetical protein
MLTLFLIRRSVELAPYALVRLLLEIEEELFQGLPPKTGGPACGGRKPI